MSLFKSTKAVVKGMFVTLKHAARPATTIQYPEVKRPPAPRYRGRHRLYKTEEGLERCIGCHLCAAACPSQAIYVEAADNTPDKKVSPGERYAVHYEINMLRCIFCGFCEEACPVDAIKLGPEYELSDFDRHALVYNKDMLLEPEKYAPKIQYHADVDKKRGGALPILHLDHVYGTHKPLGESASALKDHSTARPADREPGPTQLPQPKGKR
jgi:NADH-quinone oxidoreductase subunit I